jgi:hypothetical protein
MGMIPRERLACLLSGPGSSVAIQGEDEALFQLLRLLGVDCPVCSRIWDQFYADPVVTAAEVEQFRNEISKLRDGHAERRRQSVQRERKVRAKDPVVLRSILDQLILDDPLLWKLDQILALCDEAFSAGAALTGSSD